MTSTEILAQEKVDTKEAQTAIPGDTHFDKIENTLKDKIPNDEKKYKIFLDIFQNIKEQKNFSEDEICTFIESTNTNFNLLNRKIGNSIGEDPNKIVLENIDDFFKKIIRTSTSKEERSEAKEVKELEKIEVKTGKIEVKLEATDKEKLLEAREATQKSYDTLDPKYKVQEGEKNKVAKIKNTISPKRREALAANGLDIDTYSKFMFTKETHGEELKKEGNTEFLNNLEKLETMFPKEHITMREAADPDTTDKLIQENTELNEFTNTSERFESIATPSLPESKGFEQEFTNYVKFIPDEGIRKNIEKNGLMDKNRGMKSKDISV